MPGDRDWWRLAYDADGKLVGFEMPSANAGGPTVGYLGVLPEHRGHRYIDDLLAEITHFLAETGCRADHRRHRLRQRADGPELRAPGIPELRGPRVLSFPES